MESHKVSYSFIGLDHVQVAAPENCEEEARRFYEGILGMREIPKPAMLAGRGGAWFQCGGQQLHIGVEKVFAPAKKAHPAFSVGNLADLRERLIGLGVKVKDDDAIDDRSRFFVDDPFGNRLEFLEMK